jgi:hypothetical protein
MLLFSDAKDVLGVACEFSLGDSKQTLENEVKPNTRNVTLGIGCVVDCI